LVPFLFSPEAEAGAEMTQGKSSKRKMIYRIKFVASPGRKDWRTGAISPVPRDPYTQMHFDEIETVFRGGKHEVTTKGTEEVEKRESARSEEPGAGQQEQ
jgi:hypothetical protein